RVASGTSGGAGEVRLDSASGPVVGRCTVSGTGGWQSWSSVSCPISGATGTRDLYLRFTGGSGYLFNLNWWQFSA
ncbi:MAG: carbohydrate-binding protein, partial [Saccharothrix sp.]|nr:carbohydrate-binding protein [Saccharothrix sp.]